MNTKSDEICLRATEELDVTVDDVTYKNKPYKNCSIKEQSYLRFFVWFCNQEIKKL